VQSGGTYISKWNFDPQFKDELTDLTPQWRILLAEADTEKMVKTFQIYIEPDGF